MPNPNLPINFRKNTYIGARYVPIFSDTPGSEWDNSIQYEPLTIVLYKGNSYTSKTFVPVGADIDNDTYWAQTGNYNAQVEQYRNDVLLYLKNRPFRTAKDFNIAGKGEINNETFQHAMSTCAENGWVLWIGENITITLTDNLFMPSNLMLHLDGTINVPERVTPFKNFDGINPSSAYTGNSNIFIFGKGKIYDSTENLSPLNSCLRFAHCKNVFIDGITFTTLSFYHVIEIISCEFVHITNCTFNLSPCAKNKDSINSTIQIEPAHSASGQGGAIPYDNTPCQYIFVENCVFDNLIWGVESQAVDVATPYYHNHIFVKNNIFKNMSMAATSPYCWNDSIISGNEIDGVGVGLMDSISRGLNHVSKRLTIQNNVIKNAGINFKGSGTWNAPLQLCNIEDSIVSENMVYKCLGIGIYILRGKNILLNNNIINDCCLYNIESKTDTTALIRFDNCESLKVFGNKIFISQEDMYTQSIFSGGLFPPKSIYKDNYFQVYDLFEQYAKPILEGNFLPLLPNGSEFKPGQIIPLPSSALNYNFLVFMCRFNGAQYPVFCLTDNRMNLSLVSVKDGSALVAYLNINFSNDRKSLNFITANSRNLLTGTTKIGTENDTDVVITNIYGASMNNILSYTDYHSS